MPVVYMSLCLYEIDQLLLFLSPPLATTTLPSGKSRVWGVLGAILEPPSGEAEQGGVQTISDGG